MFIICELLNSLMINYVIVTKLNQPYPRKWISKVGETSLIYESKYNNL